MLTAEERDAFSKAADKVRQAAERQLRSSRTSQSVIAFAANLHSGASRVIQNAIEQGVNVACQAGCNHCCHARVEALAPEIFRVARELTGRPPQELNRLVRRLQTHAATRSVASAWDQRPECPFLEDGLCAIYDVRPSVCRRAHSLNVRKCQENAPEIPQDLGIVLRIAALAKGTSDAYGTLGLNASSFELGPSVLMALEDPSTESRWFSGDPVFKACAPG